MGQNPEGIPLPNPTNQYSGSVYNLAPGTYYLSGDMTLNSYARYNIGNTNNSSHRNKEYVINLNGYKLDAKNVSKRSIFNMHSGTLTIIDEPADGRSKNGKVVNSTATCVYVGPANGYKAEFHMKGGTIENCQPGNGEGGAVEVEKNNTNETAIFYMYDGAKITNCFAAQGAGVYVNGGTFYMYGGIITDNKIFSISKDAVNSSWDKPTGDNLPSGIDSYANHEADGNRVNNNYEYKGGGVYVEKGTFNMSGGEISENVSINGGGVYVVSGATFNLTGGTIKNNYASSKGSDFGNGGGIYIYGGSNCNITKGQNPLVISGNRVSKYGGGIYVNGSTVTITGVTISGNYAGSGGGLAQDGTGCTMNLNNCVVDGNFSKNNTSVDYLNEGTGGGIYIGNGTSSNKNNLNIQNTIVSNNTSISAGGGIYTGTNSLITVMTNSTVEISSNKSDGKGGGIYCGGTLNINGSGKVSNNSASYGGGACVANGTVTLADGMDSKFINNNATELGGGLYVENSTSATFSGGTFDGNNAKSGGAVAAEGNMNLTLGATIENNTATDGNGGGIYMNNGVKMTFLNGLIRTNSATTNRTGFTTANSKNHETVGGVGGGIFLGNNCTLKFDENIKEMGIYNNFAKNAGADICANGASTSIELKKVDDPTMNLKGFDVPGNSLYWIDDYFTNETYGSKTGIRYEDGLNNDEYLDKIQEYIVEGGKTYTNYLCLDLGYQMVFINLKTTGLSDNDDVIIKMSYTNTDQEDVVYRNVHFTGNTTKIVGLPSGDWKFDAETWSFKYEFNSSTPTPINNYIHIEKSGLNNNTDGNMDIQFSFIKKDNINIIESSHRKVNRLVPGN